MQIRMAGSETVVVSGKTVESVQTFAEGVVRAAEERAEVAPLVVVLDQNLDYIFWCEP